jgi:hypothetical protein
MSYFEDNKPKQYDLLEPGIYQATVNDVKPDSYKDTPTFSISYKLDNGRLVFQNFFIDEKSKKYLTWQCGILGLTSLAKAKIKDPAAANPTEVQKAYIDASRDILGKKVQVELKNEVYAGKTRQRVYLIDSKELPNMVPNFDQKEDELPF